MKLLESKTIQMTLLTIATAMMGFGQPVFASDEYRMIDLETLGGPGSVFDIAVSANNRGQVVGDRQNPESVGGGDHD
jgi:hypothetical protein